MTLFTLLFNLITAFVSYWLQSILIVMIALAAFLLVNVYLRDILLLVNFISFSLFIVFMTIEHKAQEPNRLASMLKVYLLEAN